MVLDVTIPFLPICGSGANVVSNVDEYLFFDKAHPSATMHKIIGQFAVMNIGDADTDGDGTHRFKRYLVIGLESRLLVNAEGLRLESPRRGFRRGCNCKRRVFGHKTQDTQSIQMVVQIIKRILMEMVSTDDIDPCPLGSTGRRLRFRRLYRFHRF